MTQGRSWRCPHCGADNRGIDQACESCGEPRAEATRAEHTYTCRLDGGPQHANGYCILGDGWPAYWPCQFACPLCRHALTWAGTCHACAGCSTGRREDWTAPGDEYRIAENGHWQRVAPGPRPLLTPDQNIAAIRVVMAVFDGRIKEQEGHARIDDIAAGVTSPLPLVMPARPIDVDAPKGAMLAAYRERYG